MQKHSYSLDTGTDCIATGLATGTEGCTAAPGIGMPAGGHTGFGILPASMWADTTLQDTELCYYTTLSARKRNKPKAKLPPGSIVTVNSCEL